MSERWIIAQEEPGPTEHVGWSLIDLEVRGVRGHLLGESLATQVAESLNVTEGPAGPDLAPVGPPRPIRRVSKSKVAERLDEAVQAILDSAPRDCEHGKENEPPVIECAVCMAYEQAQDDVKVLQGAAEDIRGWERG